jgi:hypothetical protein
MPTNLLIVRLSIKRREQEKSSQKKIAEGRIFFLMKSRTGNPALHQKAGMGLPKAGMGYQ